MWKNKEVIAVAVMAIWAGFVNAESSISSSGVGGLDNAALRASKFEGRLEFHKPLAVGIVAGTAEYPQLVRIEWIRFETTYGNAWGITARVGWSLVKDAAWRLKVELLDEKGQVLRHSRDEATVFTGKAGKPGQTNTLYADLDLDAMQDQGRRHATRFRIRLEPLERQVSDTDSADIDTHTLEIVVVNQENKKPIADAAVVVGSSYRQKAYRRDKTLYPTDSQGRCRIKLAGDGLVLVRINAQKQGFATAQKSWSNYGSSALGRAPLVNLPQRHVLEIVRASSIGGIVRDTEGNAIEAAEVRFSAQLEDPGGRVYINRSVKTDANGRWSVEGVPSELGRVSVGLRHPEYGGDHSRSRRITGQALLNARALKHIEILKKGLTIKGKVLNNQGDPIIKATVLMTQRSYSPIHTLTDASGAFRLMCADDMSAYREVPTLVVEAPGYAPVQQAIYIKPKIEPLEFRLTRGRSITCRVLNTEGQPVVGAWTVVEPLLENSNYSVWLEDTDEQGKFQVPNVPKNDVNLTVGKEGYVAVRDYVLALSEEEVVVTMKRALRVHGTVTDAESGKPIPNFEIADMYTLGSRTHTSNPVAFAGGAYELSFDEARPETRQLKVSAIGYKPAISENIKIDEGERVINFKLTKDPSFDTKGGQREYGQARPTGPRQITGVVRDEKGKLVSDAIVSTRPGVAEDTITNAEGRFKLRCRSRGTLGSGLGEDMVYLLVRHKERNLAAAVELDDNAETVEIKLIPGVILSGKVVDVEGKGIPNADISLTFWISDYGHSSREVTEINAEGHYEIRAVSSGHRYSVNASAEGYGRQYIPVNTSESVDGRIELEPMVLAVADLSISGVVVDVEDKPIAGVRIYTYGRGQPNRNTITDEKGRFLIENICEGRIQIQANTSGQTRLYGRVDTEGGATEVKIVLSERPSATRFVPKQPPSLAGKSLPDFSGIKSDFSVEQGKGKMILACFFDMEQRPSRNCLRQLSIRAQELKAKDVGFVAVHASKVNKDRLDNWVKENNIPFPVGMVQSDEEKIRFTWGVRSLPWLILTDTNQLVRAEGFTLQELDAKLKQIVGD
jgi:hypothetical protein